MPDSPLLAMVNPRRSDARIGTPAVSLRGALQRADIRVSRPAAPPPPCCNSERRQQLT